VQRRLVDEDATQDSDGLVPVEVRAEAEASEPFGVARIEMPLYSNFVV
jgi:hypothetical protein